MKYTIRLQTSRPPCTPLNLIPPNLLLTFAQRPPILYISTLATKNPKPET